MNWLPVCWNYQTLNSSLWLRTAAVLPKESGHGEERWLSQWKAGGITYIGKIPLMPNPGLQSAKLGLISNSIYSTDSLQGLMFNAWRSMAHSIKPIWKRKASVHFTWLFFHLHEACSKPFPSYSYASCRHYHSHWDVSFFFQCPGQDEGLLGQTLLHIAVHKSYITGSCFASRLA